MILGAFRALDAGVLSLERLVVLVRGADLSRLEQSWDRLLEEASKIEGRRQRRR